MRLPWYLGTLSSIGYPGTLGLYTIHNRFVMHGRVPHVALSSHASFQAGDTFDSLEAVRASLSQLNPSVGTLSALKTLAQSRWHWQ